MDDLQRILRRRLLRIYEGIARERCRCDTCQEWIQPGDKYRCEVSALRLLFKSGKVKDTISTWKQHLDCELPDPEEDEEEEDEGSVDLPIAA